MGEGLIVRRGGAVGDVGIFIEPGLIVEFFGLSSNIPNGWQLCDGTNDTPNLIDKFIIGAGDTYAIGDTGGSADAIVPNHTHENTVTPSFGNHSHGFPGRTANSSGSGFCIQNSDENTFGSFTTGAGGAHSHTVTFTSTGEAATDKNLPLYLSLFHIMKMEE